MQHIKMVKNHGIALVTIGTPEMIYLTAQTGDELDAVTREIESDQSVRAVVFTGGSPGVFIQHYSVQELVSIAEQLRASGVRFDERSEPQSFSLDSACGRVETMPKPAIAAINGNCMGGGLEFALCCDIRIVEDGPYQLGLPEVTVGILPGGGGTQRLPRVVGTARALEFMLLGRRVTPREAAAFGLVNELANGKALERAMELAGQLASQSPRAMAHIKRLARSAMQTPIAEGLRLERNLFMDLMTTDWAIDAMKAYVKNLEEQK
ncbi:MAG: enoyl-CoA hydratase-related protein [Candidatus Binatus sp.]|uniref:enoyl-CoA hydratase/isomerase family protein n=1 Tax=Candidatus Binatus sp. TaxID=2811406 RepID=UPI003C793A36